MPIQVNEKPRQRRCLPTGAAPRGGEVDHDPTAAHVRIVHVPRDGLGGHGGGHVRVVRLQDRWPILLVAP